MLAWACASMSAAYISSHARASAHTENFGNSSEIIQKLGKLFQIDFACIFKNIYPCGGGKGFEARISGSNSSSSSTHAIWVVCKERQIENIERHQ